MDNYCETAQVSLDLDPQGRHWEHFFVSGRYAFSNQIPNRQSFTTTNPGEVLAARGLCYWRGQAQQPPAMANTTTMAPGEGGAAGLLLVVGMVGSGIYAWMTRRNIDADADYHPMADVPPLPLPPGLTTQGNSTHGIPTVEAPQFDRNSHEFERNSHGADANSQNDQTANSLGIPGVVADSQVWPPKTMGAAYDATQPEQEGEFETYCRRLEADGLNPRGNDIIRLIWGVTPGRSAAYECARKRRDDFAKRLDYYRFEGA